MNSLNLVTVLFIFATLVIATEIGKNIDQWMLVDSMCQWVLKMVTVLQNDAIVQLKDIRVKPTSNQRNTQDISAKNSW